MNRNQWIAFRLTEEENREIEEKMRELGISNKSLFARKMALDGYCVRLQMEDIKEMVSLIGHTGGNLNQYAKRANALGDIYREDIRELEKEFYEIRERMTEILKRLAELE